MPNEVQDILRIAPRFCLLEDRRLHLVGSLWVFRLSKKCVDNSEPDPYMEEAAEALHRDFQAGGLALVGFVASSPAFMQIWRRSSERRCPKANLEA